MKHAYEAIRRVRVEMDRRRNGYHFAQNLANSTGMTRAEVELSLFVLRTNKMVRRCDDGRWTRAPELPPTPQ